MTLSRNRLNFGFRVLFYLACAAVLAGALAPVSGESGSGVDKVQHLSAFYVLTLLAIASHPRTKLLFLALGLAGFGAAIEVLQGIPIFARDCDIADWIADILGIALALTPLAAAFWRRLAASSDQ